MPTEPDRRLRAALDSATPPVARADFKAQLERRFLSGSVETSGELPGELEPLLDSWSVPAARPEFRASLRERFVSGVPAEAARGGHATPIHSIRRYLMAAAAAAALVLAWYAPWRSTAADGWQAIGFEALETTPVVAIDGRPVPYSDAASLDSAFHRGCRLETQADSLLLLRLEEGLVLEIAETTRLDVVRELDGDGVLNLRLVVSSGALSVSTRPEFTGTIEVRTPDAEITLAGRSLGVDVSDAGTCLCILEGEAQARALDGSRKLRVLSNSTAFFYRDGSESVLMEGEVHHSEPLEAVREAGESYLY